MRVGGIILCGGKSTRMGKPKAWLSLGDETFLERVIRIAGQVVSPIAVVAATEQELPHLGEGVILVRDAFPEEGPLRGMAGGMAALAGLCEAAFITSCDVPFLQVNFIRFIVGNLQNKRWCVPVASGFTHPLAGVYRLDLLPCIEGLLQEKKYRPAFLFEQTEGEKISETTVREVDPQLESLWNINNPGDYEKALEKFHKNSAS
ncbi:MAG: molybdenum cofactor guanylyltransferase [Gemmataceae bacterium]|nr:molybdenum cofactor guanylyltransferase [Gemmataceae bacterium]